MGYRSVFTQQHSLVTAVRLAVAAGLLWLALPALPAAAQAASGAATQSTAGGATQPASAAATPAATSNAATSGTTTNSAASGNLLLAQTVPPPAADTEESPALQEVVVTGFRESLTKATTAKRDAIGFTDSIYSEDIGKFADNNIAESFNRIPGITIVRDITGQGVNIAIRGLGPNFTKVLLNGAPVEVASSGPYGAQNTNQQVDLNMFPTELFTSLTVEKTSSADMLEGGAAGTVNMRSARPFDSPGQHLAFGAQGTKDQNAGAWGNHDYVVASDTFENGFGVLLGGVVTNNEANTPGYETVGWTNPQLSVVTAPSASNPAGISAAQAQCLASACNTTGGGNWTIPATVPTTAGNGLVPGTVINQAFLLAENPGASIQQIDNGIIPRLSRPTDGAGTYDTYNGVFSLEYRPSDALHFYMDNMYGKEKNEWVEEDMDWVGRNGSFIPINEKFDSSNCTNGCTVTSATFANSQFFLEYRPYTETTEFWGTNPGLNWRATDWLSGDVQANYTKSTFHREVPSVLVATANDVTINYTNDGGIPLASSNVNLDDPANFSWVGGRVNMQDERRETTTKGARFDLTFGKGGAFNVKFGGSYDDIWRHINGYDSSQQWQNAACGDDPNIFLNTPNTEPPCQGLSTATPGAGYPTYPALGVGGSAGMAGPLVYQGSLIPASALGQYLYPGPNGFITLNWNQLKANSDYAAIHANEAVAGGANTGASGGYVRTSDGGLYVEFTGDTDILGQAFRYNAGVRLVRTMQYINGPVSIANPLNSGTAGTSTCPNNTTKALTTACDGSFYGNAYEFPTTENNYNNTLPSLELVYNIRKNFLARFAASKSMTRPDPSSMLPGVNFGDPSAATGTVGNPALSPYISKNLDFGLEYYTGKEGYAAVTVFQKKITGFTQNFNVTYPFAYLAQFGINYATLNPTQQAAINSRGGPDAATVVLTQQQNATGLLTVRGEEVDWTQPFDFLLHRFNLDGFGFSANYTHINQTGTGAAPAVAVGVPPDTYNLTFYYERGPYSFRVSENYNAANPSTLGNQNGITAASIYSSSFREWDLSSYVDVGTLLRWPVSFQVTANVLNIFDAKQRSYFQFTDATYSEYNPGHELMIGFRAKF